ncbi:MAG: PAS domain-containing protein [Candidatus Eremiobacteraeota bacterium]|nr:PAS domain-containing protein [Candidatus Eremiobacteraeota bacterium]
MTVSAFCHLVTGSSFLTMAILLTRHLHVSRQPKLLPWSIPFLMICGFSRLGEALFWSWPWQEFVLLTEVLTAAVSVASTAGLAYVLPDATEERVRTTLQEVTVSQEAQEYADSLLPLAAFVCSADGSDLAVNSAYRELLGRSMEEVRGYRYLAYVHPDDRAVAGDKWRAFCLGQVKEYVENFRWTHPRGEKTLQVKGGHRPNGQHYGIVTDLTDHLLYHEKLRKVKDYALE